MVANMLERPCVRAMKSLVSATMLRAAGSAGVPRSVELGVRAEEAAEEGHEEGRADALVADVGDGEGRRGRRRAAKAS